MKAGTFVLFGLMLLLMCTFYIYVHHCAVYILASGVSLAISVCGTYRYTHHCLLKEHNVQHIFILRPELGLS